MDVTTSIREDDGKTQVTIDLTEDEVKQHIDAFFKDIRKTRIPGFRPGKAPRKVLEQAYGGHDAVYSQITSDMVNEVTPLALDSVDVIFISDPDMGEPDNVQDKKPYTYTVAGEVKPTVELSSYDPVAIDMPPEHVTDAEVDIQLGALQDYYYSFEDVDGRAVQDGDYVMADIESTADGEPLDVLTSPSRLVEVGGEVMPKAFTEELVGMKTGDTKEFDWEPADDDGIDAKKVHSKVTVNKIQVKQKPELDDEFAKRVGVDSIDELRKQVREQIEQTKQQQFPDLKEQRCVKALAERIEGEVPESFVNFERQDILRGFFNSLQQQNMTFDRFLQQNGITAEQFSEDLSQEAKENAEESVALDALFEHLGMELTEDDIDKEFQTVDDPAGIRKQWEDEGRMSTLREAIRRQKAAQWLIDNAVVTEVEPGSGDDDEEEANK